MTVAYHTGNNIDILRTMPDNSVDSVVTDPPYGLGKEPDIVQVMRAWCDTGHYDIKGKGFMGKEWDAFVPQPLFWKEVYRVLKPGGHMVVACGTRTQDWMAASIRFAGFEIRNCVAWLYGCLSEDTEVLTRHGWVSYNNIDKYEEILTYNTESDVYTWEVPKKWQEYNIKDTAYRIQSDNTDQLVSRNHRCLVEREGKLVFRFAETLQRKENIPFLESLPKMPKTISNNHKRAGFKKQILWNRLLFKRKNTKSPHSIKKDNNTVRCLWEKSGTPKFTPKENIKSNMFNSLQRCFAGKRFNKTFSQGTEWMDGKKSSVLCGKNVRRKEPCMEGRSYLLQKEGEIFVSENKSCEVSEKVYKYGSKGWICNGTQIKNGNSGRETINENRVCSSYKSRRNGQQDRKSYAFQNKPGSQNVRGRISYKTTMATVTAIYFVGKVFCPTVSTGSFLARRNGKIFITGNSGFPKSLAIDKALDKMAGAEREVVGNGKWNNRKPNGSLSDTSVGLTTHSDFKETAPATEAAKQWEGFGTDLKPAMELWTVARKPLSEPTVAANVLKWGTGGLNIDGSRVGTEDNLTFTHTDKTSRSSGIKGNVSNSRAGDVWVNTQGRFPANVIHDGSEEVVSLFPVTKSGKAEIGTGTIDCQNNGIYNSGKGGIITSCFADQGSAARFFKACEFTEEDYPPVYYCAKASRSERNEGCNGLDDKYKAHGNQAQAELKRGNTDFRIIAEEGKSVGFNAVTTVKNNHATVKPVTLMRYLCRLITPPGGTILDPFCGSGTTGVGAVQEGFSVILIDQEKDYMDITMARVNHAMNKVVQSKSQLTLSL